MMNVSKIFLIILLSFLLSCQIHDKTKGEHDSTSIAQFDENIDNINLIGSTVEYKYGEDIYHVTIDSDSTLHWKAVEGGEKGITANEKYELHHVRPKLVFITWGEENGIGVSQILDFEQGVVYNHLLRGRDISKGTGLIKIID